MEEEEDEEVLDGGESIDAELDLKDKNNINRIKNKRLKVRETLLLLLRQKELLKFVKVGNEEGTNKKEETGVLKRK